MELFLGLAFKIFCLFSLLFLFFHCFLFFLCCFWFFLFFCCFLLFLFLAGKVSKVKDLTEQILSTLFWGKNVLNSTLSLINECVNWFNEHCVWVLVWEYYGNNFFLISVKSTYCILWSIWAGCNSVSRNVFQIMDVNSYLVLTLSKCINLLKILKFSVMKIF